jgi:hypothetical protein
MIEQKLQNYFKRFTAITPRSEFVMRSRMQVTSSGQLPIAETWLSRMKESLTTGSALALASLLLLIVLGSISYVSKQGGQMATTSSLSNDTLTREAAQLSFQVQLKDAEYFDESASQVVRALDSIANERVIQ